MDFSARQIADFLHGEVIGNENIRVSSLSKIEEGKPGTLTFLANAKYTHHIYTTQASIVLVNTDFIPEQSIGATLIKVENAYNSLALLLNMVEQAKPKKKGISSLAFISPTSTVGENAYIGEFAYIGENCMIGKNARIYPQVYVGDNVTLKENVILYPGAKIYEGCVIGNNCILHAGSVIGSDGFGFAPSADGYSKIPQIGIVTIEDNVEIGANTTIDRATMGTTYIHKGVKLDNLIQVAHNVEIGEHTVMAAQVGIAGSTKIGEWCMVGGQVGFAGHIHVAAHSNIGAQAGVSADVKTASSLLGAPAIDFKDFARSNVVYKKLPELYKTVSMLQKEIEALKSSIAK